MIISAPKIQDCLHLCHSYYSSPRGLLPRTPRSWKKGVAHYWGLILTKQKVNRGLEIQIQVMLRHIRFYVFRTSQEILSLHFYIELNILPWPCFSLKGKMEYWFGPYIWTCCTDVKFQDQNPWSFIFLKAKVKCQHLITGSWTINMSCVLFSFSKPLEAGITDSLRLFKAGHLRLK